MQDDSGVAEHKCTGLPDLPVYLLILIVGYLKKHKRTNAILCCKALRDAWRALVKTLSLPAEGVLEQAAWHKYPHATALYIPHIHRCGYDKAHCEVSMTAWFDRLKQSLDSIPSGRAIRRIELSYGECPFVRSAMTRALELLASHAAVADHIQELELWGGDGWKIPDHLAATSLQRLAALERLGMDLVTTGASNAELLWQALLCCMQLRCLSLQLPRCSPQANPSLQLLVAQLHKLSLCTTKQSPKDLAAVLRGCKQLRQLDWRSNTQRRHADSEYEELCDVLESMPFLEELTANTTRCSLASLVRCPALRKAWINVLLISPADLAELAQEQLCSKTIKTVSLQRLLYKGLPVSGCLVRALPRLEHFGTRHGVEEAVECLRGHQHLRCFDACSNNTCNRSKSWQGWALLLRAVASWPVLVDLVLPLPGALGARPQLDGRGMEELAAAASHGSLRKLQRMEGSDLDYVTTTHARVGLADAMYVLGPEGLLGSVGLTQASLLVAVGQDVRDLEWGLEQLLEAGGAEQEGDGGAGVLHCSLLGHVGRMLAAQPLLLTLQQRLQLDLARAEAEAEAEATAREHGIDSGAGEPAEDGIAEQGAEAGNRAFSPEDSWLADRFGIDAGTLPAMWKDGSGGDPQQAVSSMVQHVAEALPDASVALGAGWQQDLAGALLLRWQVLGQLRRLCSCKIEGCYDEAGTYIGMRRLKCVGACRGWIQPQVLQYRDCTVTLAGLDH